MNQRVEIARWDAKGVTAAVVIVGLWLICLTILLTKPLSWQLVVLGLPVQTFLYTGLFITAHDAMHRTVAPSWPRVNRGMGALAVALYALFSFQKLLRSHTAHHAHPGLAGQDPDFHDGSHTSFWRWYLHFLKGYINVWQILGMAVAFNVLEHLLGVSLGNLLWFWVAPALLSTIQLFYFGTYLPHRGEHANRHNARSNAYSTWVSFLTCYHFGYHREHHEHPGVPWWHLPTIRRATLNAERPKDQSPEKRAPRAR